VQEVVQEVVQETVQKQEINEEKNLEEKNESLRQTPGDVTQKKTKIISPSKNEIASFEGASKACDDRSAEIPSELIEKLEELRIPLDNQVRSALARHDISQAYGAAASNSHFEEEYNLCSLCLQENILKFGF
jgi:predicted FMN-binding regulatory protein PaiB